MEVGQQTSYFPSGFLFLLGYVLLRLFVRCVRSVCCSWGFWGVWALPAEAVMGEHSFLSGRWLLEIFDAEVMIYRLGLTRRSGIA